jgi:hypothetical protein
MSRFKDIEEQREYGRKNGLCKKCGLEEKQEPHPCPYQEEMNDDRETLCTCCPDCEKNCRLSI